MSITGFTLDLYVRYVDIAFSMVMLNPTIHPNVPLLNEFCGFRCAGIMNFIYYGPFAVVKVNSNLVMGVRSNLSVVCSVGVIIAAAVCLFFFIIPILFLFYTVHVSKENFQHSQTRVDICKG